jgi:hypothetical protein
MFRPICTGPTFVEKVSLRRPTGTRRWRHRSPPAIVQYQRRQTAGGVGGDGRAHIERQRNRPAANHSSALRWRVDDRPELIVARTSTAIELKETLPATERFHARSWTILEQHCHHRRFPRHPHFSSRLSTGVAKSRVCSPTPLWVRVTFGGRGVRPLTGGSPSATSAVPVEPPEGVAEDLSRGGRSLSGRGWGHLCRGVQHSPQGVSKPPRRSGLMGHRKCSPVRTR